MYGNVSGKENFYFPLMFLVVDYFLFDVLIIMENKWQVPWRVKKKLYEKMWVNFSNMTINLDQEKLTNMANFMGRGSVSY